ncbi:hypothetical protein DFJ63DRAFT_337762 [Scheffersomyces coipomensis]|uniref:uncharacterized protein n=1 Tax=Scheffersomyces coipomensis TaxID=1788519 RepID=UPI00315D64A1
MSGPAVAPYGGFLVKTLDEEKEREQKLQEQSSIEVNINGTTETIRPEALHIRGVDNLSSEDIKSFVDYYVNYIVTKDEETNQEQYEQLPLDEQITFRIQWVNDSSINVTFKTHEECFKVLKKLSITSSNPAIYTSEQPQELTIENVDYVADIIQERESKPYTPILNFIKHRDLSARLGLGISKEGGEDGEEAVAQQPSMEEDESSIVLYLRQAFQSDRKVKNAKLYSRYYLLHGEPERQTNYRRNNYRDRERRPRRNEQEEEEQKANDDDEDLFAEKINNPNRVNFTRTNDRTANFDHPNEIVPDHQEEEEEEDLFAYKLRERERSPSRR